MDTTAQKVTKYKTIKVDEETHRRLKIYAAANNFRTIGESVQDLLKKSSFSFQGPVEDEIQ